jgi:putative acetyltransferase
MLVRFAPMIRPFKISDMEEVLNLWLEASVQSHSFMPMDYWQSKLPQMREEYLPMSETFVYELPNGRIGGFISLVDRHIAAAFVHPQVQGRGIGQALIQLAKVNTLKLTTCVYQDNARALHFYQKEGFVIKHTDIEKQTGHTEYLLEFSRC